MKLLFEEEGKKLFFSLSDEEKLKVEIEAEGLNMSVSLTEKEMLKLIEALKLIIYED